jgi:hypothetical protein
MHYCDYIGNAIKANLKEHDQLVQEVGGVTPDLDQNGVMLSTKKRIEVVDVNGQRYRITVEAL